MLGIVGGGVLLASQERRQSGTRLKRAESWASLVNAVISLATMLALFFGGSNRAAESWIRLSRTCYTRSGNRSRKGDEVRLARRFGGLNQAPQKRVRNIRGTMWASLTRAGPRTVARRTRTRIRTLTNGVESRSCTTAPSTMPTPFGGSCRSRSRVHLRNRHGSYRATHRVSPRTKRVGASGTWDWPGYPHTEYQGGDGRSALAMRRNMGHRCHVIIPAITVVVRRRRPTTHWCWQWWIADDHRSRPGQVCVASEPAAFNRYTKNFIAMQDGEIGVVAADGTSLDLSRIEVAPNLNIESSPAPYPHWTIKVREPHRHGVAFQSPPLEDTSTVH